MASNLKKNQSTGNCSISFTRDYILLDILCIDFMIYDYCLNVQNSCIKLLNYVCSDVVVFFFFLVQWTKQQLYFMCNIFLYNFIIISLTETHGHKKTSTSVVSQPGGPN